MFRNQSGRVVPPKPGWVGASTRYVADIVSAKRATDIGPAPPCRTSTQGPEPRSVKETVSPSSNVSRRVVGGRFAVFMGVTFRGHYGGRLRLMGYIMICI